MARLHCDPMLYPGGGDVGESPFSLTSRLSSGRVVRLDHSKMMLRESVRRGLCEDEREAISSSVFFSPGIHLSFQACYPRSANDQVRGRCDPLGVCHHLSRRTKAKRDMHKFASSSYLPFNITSSFPPASGAVSAVLRSLGLVDSSSYALFPYHYISLSKLFIRPLSLYAFIFYMMFLF